MKNKFIYITIFALFFAFSLQQTYAQKVEPNKDYYQAPKNHVVLIYQADLGATSGWEIAGQDAYLYAFRILNMEGYEFTNIWDPLNGGRFIEFKKKWEANKGGIVFFNNHGNKADNGKPAVVQIGMFDNWQRAAEFVSELFSEGFDDGDYFIENGHYNIMNWTWTSVEETKPTVRVYLTLPGIRKLKDKKDLVIWGPCHGEATQEAVQANIVFYRIGGDSVEFSEPSTRCLFSVMCGAIGTENLSFTKAFEYLDVHWEYKERVPEPGTGHLIVEQYSYRGPDDGVDLVLNPYIKEIKYVDDSSADIHFATKMKTRDFGVGERPVYVQAGTANCPSAQVDYSPDLKPRWIDEQTLRVTMNWGQCSVFPRWAKIIVRASYFQAKDNPHFYLNGRTYVEEGLKEHDGDGCRGYRSLGEPPYIMVDDDWFWIVGYNDPNGKSGEIFNDFRPH